MAKLTELGIIMLIGLFTTSSSIVGAAIGLYANLSKRVLAVILAFAAGSLISALAIDLAFKGAMDLHQDGFGSMAAWKFIAGGFACGAVIYFVASQFLEKKGAAVRRPTQFKEYALARKQEKTKELVGLLSQCDLLRHLPPEAIESILPNVRQRRLEAEEVLFRAGDPSDALFIVSDGSVEVMADSGEDAAGPASSLAELKPGSAFGEMGLLSGGTRTATVRSAGGAGLLEIGRDDFNALIAADPVMAHAVRHLSHQRAINNLSSGGTNPLTWAKVAMTNLDHLSRNERNQMLVEAGHGAGMAIVLGNILDTIPGCLVIGASFNGFANLSLTLMFGMFLGGIPEAAVSAAMLTKAGYKPKFIFGLWTIVLITGMVAAVAGKLLLGSSHSHLAVFFEAVAGGAVLALVSHAMIPEAIHEGGSLVVLPTVAGFLFALFLALSATFV
jgi:CRP-like cAMP-binding protein